VDTSPASQPTPPTMRATWREWLGLALMCLPMLALATDISVLFLAMPSISADLQPGTSQMLWILHIYGFLIGGLLITMGRLGDRIGRRKLLLIGTAAFSVLAVAAAYSTSATMLIVVRALLGVAGATLMPSTYSLLRPMFPDARQRRYAIAAMFATFNVGTALGPLLGGALLEYFWWGSVFLINVPPLVLLLVFAPALLPEHRDEASQPLDLRSVALSLGGILAIIYGLQEAAEHGLALHHVASVLGGIVLGVAFVRRQWRLRDPLLDLALFTNRRFTASLGMVLLSAIGGVGAFYLFTQYLQWVAGLSPLEAGLWTIPYSVVAGAGALVGPVLTRWLPHATVIGVGLGLAAVSLSAAAFLSGEAGLVAVVGALCVAAIGQGAAMSLGSDLIISTAPSDRTGSAAAMLEVSGELGTALGVAFGGGVGMMIYRASFTDGMPIGVPEGVADAALDSVSGALAAAERLGAPLGPELLRAAQDAFTSALQTGFGLGAVILAPVAVMVLVLLRQATPPTSDAQAEVG
jgi:MFS transporter, DHA2 family, multidrug resistance protein